MPKYPGETSQSKEKIKATTIQSTFFLYNGRLYNRGRIILTTDKASMAVFICKLH